ncbi:zinc-ribbon and DUF3426 domain-containing protein [Marinomonas algicola]|uniref:zinc-ribbon and DUF3426 domain-containing protein n=1 Tax=Marinomonas algicola TaxID=2773454 RepID=UPI00174DEE28|nr:zinc-ribbon and DUF3426 domain-containing protein [Marinomonas algicola]
MTDSLITRCPKCSTAFRVGADILAMAKGKVRCGQCFHIFEAKPIEEKKNSSSKTPLESEKTEPTKNKQLEKTSEVTHSDSVIKNAHLNDENPIVNPEWLHTLFDDDDLSPIDKHNSEANLNPSSKKAIERNKLNSEQEDDASESYNNHLAPWEREFAELDPSSNTDIWNKKEATKQASASQPTSDHHAKTQVYNESIKNLIRSEPKRTEPNHESKPSDFKSYTEEQQEPDYMKALHTLAHSTNEPAASSTDHSHNKSKEQAFERLAPLINNEDVSEKKSHTIVWLLGIFILTLTLLLQTAYHFFETGSRSAQFRPFYKIFCTYTGCVIPNFEDITAINIQHVRIQSHPSQENALLVNAIMTNTSRYSQTMPKIALEFFDLNGAPVAARLFSPNNFLHKDFLDITYMPPNTPIHIVIPIYDPGAQAVTHRLEIYPSNTESY